MLPVTIWMNMPSPYQSDLFRALVASGVVDLEVIFARDLPEDRRYLGWCGEVVGYSSRLLRDHWPMMDAVRLAWSRRRRLHIVNGIWAEPAFAAALAALAATGSRYAIYSEAPEPKRRSLAGAWVRSVLGRMFVRRAIGLLPVASLGARFFSSLGAPMEAIYPFGYFRSGQRCPERDSGKPEKRRIEVLFVGQLISRKGVDLLLSSLAPLFAECPDLSLVLVGRGDLLPALQREVEAMGGSSRVMFEGALPAEAIPGRMTRAALLVLPSRWDGWGVVVNEALSAGVPVIVSDRCGAADLIRDGVNGYVFPSENAAALQACLRAFLERRADWPLFRERAARTGAAISPDEIAPYLIACLQHMIGASRERPVAPWLKAPGSTERRAQR
jgi:glycosyltransferase involved in cell wall biosynthesis